MRSGEQVDWFERLFGFAEGPYAETQSRLTVEGSRLRSQINGKSYGIGRLDVESLDELRARLRAEAGGRGRLRVQVVRGDVRELHRAPEFAGALFQVASQFNLLEMTGPRVTPERGVTVYQTDHTQGPACAIAAGAATVYRNYFAPIGGQIGQTSVRQIDCLAGVGEGLAAVLGKPAKELWSMYNGYARCTRAGLDAISGWMDSASPAQVDEIRSLLRIGLHWDVEVTDAEGPDRPMVSQAFCSALPVAYYPEVPRTEWRHFASLVLDAAYEATLWAAVCNAERGASNVVLLTLLGGGAFGNRDEWIHAAMRRALQLASGFELDVRLVSYGPPSREMTQLVEEFG
jgi:hypothetical protein